MLKTLEEIKVLRSSTGSCSPDKFYKGLLDVSECLILVEDLRLVAYTHLQHGPRLGLTLCNIEQKLIHTP